MAAIIDSPTWATEIYQLETTDPVLGGTPNPLTGAGLDNIPHLQLAQRTRWLKQQVEALEAALGTANTLLAPKASPVFTGNPTAPTAAQFDNDTSLATTAFVQRALGSVSGVLAINANTNLSAADAGKRIDFYGSAPFTVTLPALAGIADGTQFILHSDASAPVTIASTGGTPFAVAGASVSTVVVGPGEYLVVTKGAGVFWRTYGSAVLKNEAQFAASLAGSGFQRFPSGLILQWGSITTSSSGPVTGTFPIAFPTACRNIVGTADLNSAVAVESVEIGSLTASTFSIATVFQTSLTNAGSAANSSVRWQALGN